MIIKRLELQGFKTFPERTKILFHPGITAVVGPNGTGKSNLVDSILWVLGGQRMKSLRGEKIEDVIFNGNAKRPPLGMADVNLILENEEEELHISHRVFRSGESEYRVNGKTVRLKDILDELWKRSISENKYFVIEQGAIGLFITSKPTDKRALLEEAAGTAFYKDKKKQAENKLESTEQNLTRLEDIISEVAKAKNSLQRQAHAAEKYRKLRERIRELTAFHFRNKHKQLKNNLKEVQAQYEQCLNGERELLSRTGTEERELNRKRKEAWDIEQSIKHGQENLYSLKSQAAKLEAEAERETKRIEFFEEKREKAVSDAEELRGELGRLEKDLLQAEEDLRSTTQTFRLKRQEAERCEQEYAQIQAQIEPWTKKLEALRNKYLQKLAELTEIKNEEAKAEKEIELVLRQVEKLRTRREEEQARLEATIKELEHRENILAQNHRLREEKETRLAELREALKTTSTVCADLQKKRTDLKEKKEAKVYHLQALKKLQEKEQGAAPGPDLPGTLGLFTDLLEADPADVPLIDVFWKEEAKAAVIPVQDILNRLGGEITGRFLLLSEEKKATIPEEVLGNPEVIGLLKSRLRPKQKIEKYLPQLQEAVLVKDIQAAVRLWLRFPSHNYLSLRGDLLLHSGLLQLGERKEGIFALSQEMKELEKKISLYDSEMLPITAELDQKFEENQRHEEEIKNESGRLASLQKNILDLEKEIALQRAEKENCSANLALLGHELDVLNLDMQGFTQKMEVLTQRMNAVEEEERALKNKVEVEDREFSRHQEKSSQLGQHLAELKGNQDVLQEKMNNLQGLIQSLRQRRESAAAKIQSLEEEVRNSAAEEVRLKEHIQGLLDKRKSLEEEKDRMETTIAQNETRLQQLQKELSEAEIKVGEIRLEQESQKDERIKWEIKKAETERDLINLEETCWQDLKKTLQEIKEEMAEAEAPEVDVETELEAAREDLQKFKAVNLMAEEEYIVHKERCDFLIQQRTDLKESIAQTKEAILKIDEESQNRFLTALDEVNKNFQEIFSLLFKGGQAEVKLQDESNPMESGIDVIAQPPGKKLQNIILLSGGEKSLTSLAFLFALFRYKPTPFCILDEVDAALDEANLARFLELMKKIKEETQFIIITHNYKTMEVADYIYGTTMEEPNITKLFSMKLEKKREEEKS
ncbi:MAG: chromosome segregation protein SMC [Candidatus Aminicenantales bacterium]